MTEQDKYIEEIEYFHTYESDGSIKALVDRITSDTKEAIKKKADQHRMAMCLQLTDEQLEYIQKRIIDNTEVTE